jgi:hypothetical protein
MGGVQASRYNGKTYQTINVPGALCSYAEDINNAGDVVYQWFQTDFKEFGSLLHAGKYYNFDHPKRMSTGAGINDRGLIVGSYEPDNDTERGFKATYRQHRCLPDCQRKVTKQKPHRIVAMRLF